MSYRIEDVIMIKLKQTALVIILSALLLAGCSYAGYSVKSFVGTTEPNNPQHRLVTFDDLRGQRESTYEFKAGKAITLELHATKGSLDFDLRSPTGQSMATLTSSGELIIKTLGGKFEAGNYVLVLKSTTASSGSVKVFFD